MSGGQRQLLCLVLAVLGKPTVLLLDEHMASLDERYQALADLLLSAFVQTAGCAAIAVTHSRSWAESHGAALCEIVGGRLSPLH
jgi:putative ABC transport system ATP-binding protein